MVRILLFLLIAVVLVLLIRRAQNLPPHKRRSAYFQLILVLAVLGVAILTLMGKMHWVGAALTGLFVLARQSLPWILRVLPFLGTLKRTASNQKARQSEVRSSVLKMTLDHDSGELSGVVLAGSYKDWFLEELDRIQLDELMEFCRSQDSESTQLLASYLEQRFPDEDTSEQYKEDAAGKSSNELNRAEALALLGLEGDPNEEDIIAAHRVLIQKLHPDRGGSDYLAAKINEAKDFLLN